MIKFRANRFAFLAVLAAYTGASALPASEEFFDSVSRVLSTSGPDGAFRARVSGTVDLERYHIPLPSPGLISTSSRDLFSPRLTLFLDAQYGAQVYVFAQARADHGFDPSDSRARERVDEYALRLTPWSDGRVSFQFGKFATIVGNWVNRHGSWENPFISAPLPYENLTGIWDTEAVRAANQLLQWAHLRPGPAPGVLANDQKLRLPVLWGPAYATGLALSGAAGKFRYSSELKNAPLSSRPESWTRGQKWWTYPAVSARLGFVPSPMWNLGVSAATGAYLRPSARSTLAPGFDLGDYRQKTFAADALFAWHHWQIWAEIFQTRFEIPRVGDADTVAGYIETKYKFSPQFSGALRWNRQLFGTIPDGPKGLVRWGKDMWRVDVAPAYRLTPHVQLKIEYSLAHESAAPSDHFQSISAQATVRF